MAEKEELKPCPNYKQDAQGPRKTARFAQNVQMAPKTAGCTEDAQMAKNTAICTKGAKMAPKTAGCAKGAQMAKNTAGCAKGAKVAKNTAVFTKGAQVAKNTADLKPCPNCGRAVKIRQEWHYNRTRLAIHCKCGRHAATEWTWRGEPMIPREELAERWNSEATERTP